MHRTEYRYITLQTLTSRSWDSAFWIFRLLSAAGVHVTGELCGLIDVMSDSGGRFGLRFS